MPKGIRYYSFIEPSGYGLAAIAYVRALVNAGIPVQWIPLIHSGWGAVAQATQTCLDSPFVRGTEGDAALSDLPALLRRTAAPVGHDTVLCHCVPEHWPGLFERGKRNVGYTVWEADRPPPHWLPIFNAADRILVPCAQNRDSFVAAGTRPPVRVVPHIRRHAWNAFAPAERSAARAQFGIPDDHFILYSIGTWDPRKDLGALIEACQRAFAADDRVTLIVKTSATGSSTPPLYPVEPTAGLAQQALDQCALALGPGRANICVLPVEGLSGCEIDLLHEIGDCYVSLAHGEGWAMGAFDAATRGTPVVMTGWGGHLDYFGAGWTGAVPYRPGAVPIWPPRQPSYFSSQRWADPDVAAAARTLRDVRRDDTAARAEAAEIAVAIANRYSEPVVAGQLLAAIDG